MYLIFALFAGLLGTAFSVLIRLELSGPGVQYIADNQLVRRTSVTAYTDYFLYIITASKLGKGESPELNTASLRHPFFHYISQISFIAPRNKVACGVRTYSSFNNSKDYPCIKGYPDMESAKLLILEDNKEKCGVYLLTNKLTGKIYVGSSKNLSRRFKNYFSTGYLKHISRRMMVINKALLKYGYSNFKLEILEYTMPDKVFEREQHFLDLLEPKYNMLKYAGTWLGYKHSEASKLAMGVDRKGENNPM